MCLIHRCEIFQTAGKKSKCRMREKGNDFHYKLPVMRSCVVAGVMKTTFPICRCHCPLVLMLRWSGAMTVTNREGLCRHRSPLLLGFQCLLRGSDELLKCREDRSQTEGGGEGVIAAARCVYTMSVIFTARNQTVMWDRAHSSTCSKLSPPNNAIIVLRHN